MNQKPISKEEPPQGFTMNCNGVALINNIRYAVVYTR